MQNYTTPNLSNTSLSFRVKSQNRWDVYHMADPSYEHGNFSGSGSVANAQTRSKSCM